MENQNIEMVKVNRHRFLTTPIYQCDNCGGYKSDQPKRIDMNARCACANINNKK
ncbi:MAG: hypothetical protein NY202_04595 [Mollicutes bacterium UO1]